MKKKEFVYSDTDNNDYEYVVTRRKKEKKGHPFLTAILIFLVIGFIGSNSSSNDSSTPKQSNSPKATVAVTKAPTATTSAANKASALFTMFSDDTVGATKHVVVGGEYEPSGKYEVVCTSGHGVLTVNDKGFCFAADEYKGQENGSKTYEESIIITLNGNDKLTLRNYNSTTLKLKFYYIGE